MHRHCYGLNLVGYEIIKHVKLRNETRKMAADLVPLCGRPRKFAHGFPRDNKRLYLSNETFERWQRIKTELKLQSDDLVGRRLLDYYESSEESSALNVTNSGRNISCIER